MNYFQVISILFGIVLIGGRLLIHIMPEKWARFELDHVYKQKRPSWVWIVGMISLIIVSITWYMQLTSEVPMSMIVTIVVTLTLVKVSQVIFNYERFRQFAKKALTEDRSIIVKINIVTTVLGVILIVLGVSIY
ncbi:hypothetical protein [Salipaludibacillus daqingensis]|uniref:hypothetical protein n=1 Tax=Salipaludibacillus daqingensis TaxID=3041001 RepID=UPI0024763028|nr:hypothetical protein [Salipaludibacillus daqingensis]